MKCNKVFLLQRIPIKRQFLIQILLLNTQSYLSKVLVKRVKRFIKLIYQELQIFSQSLCCVSSEQNW